MKLGNEEIGTEEWRRLRVQRGREFAQARGVANLQEYRRARVSNPRQKLWMKSRGMTFSEEVDETVPILEAEVNHGRWIANCECFGAEEVDPRDGLFFCFSCGNAISGGKLRRVVFPDNYEAIEMALAVRPHEAFRNWVPGMTIEDLEQAGPFHFSWTAPRTWTTSELVTAAIMNVHVRDNLLATLAAIVTTAGDIGFATAANTLSRLAIGTARQQLNTNAGATAPEWVASLQSLFTAEGDIVYASGANTPAKLAKGSDNHVLTMNGNVPNWEAAAAGGDTVVTGSYSGDNSTSQVISGLGITPKYVRIWVRDTSPGAVRVWETTAEILDDHGDKMSVEASAWQLETNRIIAFGAGSFTVDDNGSNDHPNDSPTTYNYMAIGS